MTADKHPTRMLAVAGLLAAPPLLLMMARVLQWADRDTAQATLVGIAITAAGGTLTGITADRFLHRGRNQAENLIGLAATTFLGVLTIGYLYIAHIRGPMSTIATLPRAISQGLSFLEFLTAQGAGTLLASYFTRDRATATST